MSRPWEDERARSWLDRSGLTELLIQTLPRFFFKQSANLQWMGHDPALYVLQNDRLDYLKSVIFFYRVTVLFIDFIDDRTVPRILQTLIIDVISSYNKPPLIEHHFRKCRRRAGGRPRRAAQGVRVRAAPQVQQERGGEGLAVPEPHVRHGDLHAPLPAGERGPDPEPGRGGLVLHPGLHHVRPHAVGPSPHRQVPADDEERHPVRLQALALLEQDGGGRPFLRHST
jgi:hypothetical protein